MTRPMATSSKSVKIPKPKRVLIVYATGGMGHVTAARAVAQAFAEQFPDVAVETCDILDFASRWYRLIFVHGYNYISAKLPKFWGWLYHHYNDQSHQALGVKISQWAVERRVIAHIKSTRPDFIIATHPLPMIIVSQSKSRDVIEILSSIVVTDYGCPQF